METESQLALIEKEAKLEALRKEGYAYRGRQPPRVPAIDVKQPLDEDGPVNLSLAEAKAAYRARRKAFREKLARG